MRDASRRSFLASGLALRAAQVDAAAAKPQARYRTLGRTGLRVSEVGLGTAGLYDIALIERALDLGINFFDTARTFNNERMLGRALAARRKDAILCSRSYAKSAAAVQRDLDDSLRELGTDYLDIWYFGSKEDPAEITDDMLEVMATARKAGKIRFTAVSTHRLTAMVPLIAEHRYFDVVMVPYHFAIGTPRDPGHFPAVDQALTRFERAGAGVVAMKVMAGGYRMHQDTKGPLADVLGRPKAHLSALKWVLKDRRIHTTVPSSNSFEKLEENARAMGQTYSPEDDRLLAAHIRTIGPRLCRMCGSCDGACPQGLPVADLVRYVMYADGYGQFDMGYGGFQQLSGSQRTVRCRDCGSCPVRCPHGVQVRRQLQRAQKLFA